MTISITWIDGDTVTFTTDDWSTDVSISNSHDKTTTGTDDIIAGEGWDGMIKTINWNDNFILANEDPDSLIWPDTIGLLDLEVDDGVWV